MYACMYVCMCVCVYVCVCVCVCDDLNLGRRFHMYVGMCIPNDK